MFVAADAKANSQTQLNQNEDQLHPKTNSEDAVSAIVDSKPLVFSTEEDGAKNVTSNEEDEKSIVEMFMVICIEDGEEDKSCGPSNCCNDT